MRRSHYPPLESPYLIPNARFAIEASQGALCRMPSGDVSQPLVQLAQSALCFVAIHRCTLRNSTTHTHGFDTHGARLPLIASHKTPNAFTRASGPNV